MQALIHQRPGSFGKLWFELETSASPAAVFSAFATRAGLESWFGAVSPYKTSSGRARLDNELARAGDSFTWENFDFEANASGVVIVATESRNLTFALAGERICLRVKIHPTASGSCIEIIEESLPAHDGLRLAWELNGRMDWQSRLERLKHFCERN